MTAGKQVDLFADGIAQDVERSRKIDENFATADWPAVSRNVDPPTSHQAERDLNRSGRRPSQAEKILDRLRLGPATNAELAAISLKYTSRISDLRAKGFDVQVVEQDRATGVTIYELEEAS